MQSMAKVTSKTNQANLKSELTSCIDLYFIILQTIKKIIKFNIIFV